jgi:ribosomal protein S12 methylthiotransferase
VVDRVRLLYLYPSSLDHALIDAVLGTGVPYFDLSLQHVSRPLLQRMRRWGDGDRFLERIAEIRRDEPAATFRSSFIVASSPAMSPKSAGSCPDAHAPIP